MEIKGYLLAYILAYTITALYTKILNKEEIKAKMMELTYIQGRLAEE